MEFFNNFFGRNSSQVDDVRRPSICAAESSEEVEIVAPCEVIDSPFGVERAGGGGEGERIAGAEFHASGDGWMDGTAAGVSNGFRLS